MALKVAIMLTRTTRRAMPQRALDGFQNLPTEAVRPRHLRYLRAAEGSNDSTVLGDMQVALIRQRGPM